MSYFNAASHGLPDQSVYQAMINFIKIQAQSSSGVLSPESNAELSNAKKAVAEVLSARVDQIGFASTTTAAWHTVVGSLNLSGKRILVTEHEWGDYYRLLSKRSDIEIQVLPSLDFSKPDLTAWKDLIDEEVAAIFVPMITSISGYRYPVKEIAAIPRPAGTKLIVDAAQALGQTEVNVSDLNCDAIVCTCRKWFRGPRQVALFWINDGWGGKGIPITAATLAPPDQNQALLVGLGAAALCLLRQSIGGIEQQITTQADQLKTWAISNGIGVYGGDNAKSAIISLEFDEKGLKDLDGAFAREGIVAKIVNTHKAEPLQKKRDTPENVLRLSAHVYTSDSELEHLKKIILSAI